MINFKQGDVVRVVFVPDGWDNTLRVGQILTVSMVRHKVEPDGGTSIQFDEVSGWARPEHIKKLVIEESADKYADLLDAARAVVSTGSFRSNMMALRSAVDALTPKTEAELLQERLRTAELAVRAYRVACGDTGFVLDHEKAREAHEGWAP